MLTAAARSWFPIVDEPQCTGELIHAIVLQHRFSFNNETHTMAPGFDWLRNPSVDLEWLILLHKFYYAAGLGRVWRQTGDARYLHTWMRLTDSWIAATPIDFFSSDVCGRRIQNWISAWHYFEDAVPDDFRQRFLGSLAAQAAWLIANLTPARNHRTLELLALFLAGIALGELPQSKRWLSFAQQAIVDNLRTDFRADGVHCEQSTDYHHIVLRNALIVRRLASINTIAMPEEFDDSIRKALEFALHVHRPDGFIPSFSDGDSGTFLELFEQAYKLYGDERYQWIATGGLAGNPPAERLKAFPAGGYYILRSGWGENEDYRGERHLVFDCGPLGEGNHGHLDLLSFELYGFGRPLIVDPGRYTYDESGDTNWRAAFRCTAFHNTVLVDGRNQTRYEFHKRKFKVRGPEPDFELLGFGSSNEGFDFVRGRASSFEYDAVHEREIRMYEGGRRFAIFDSLYSANPHRYEQLFHLADPTATEDEQGVQTRHLRIRQIVPHVTCNIDPGWISRTYGEKEPSAVVRFSQTGTTVRFETHLELMP